MSDFYDILEKIGCDIDELYENQRWNKKSGFAIANLRNNDPSRWSAVNPTKNPNLKSPSSTIKDNYSVLQAWKYGVDDNTDSGGWKYAVDWNSIRWKNKNFDGAFVRRRKWIRISSSEENKEEALNIINENKPSLQPIAKEGWLTKRGQIFKSWKKRYFILQNGLLSYYDKEPHTGHNSQPKGAMPLKDATISAVSASTFGKEFCFEISRTRRTLYLVAESIEELESWANILNLEAKRANGEVVENRLTQVPDNEEKKNVEEIKTNNNSNNNEEKKEENNDQDKKEENNNENKKETVVVEKQSDNTEKVIETEIIEEQKKKIENISNKETENKVEIQVEKEDENKNDTIEKEDQQKEEAKKVEPKKVEQKKEEPKEKEIEKVIVEEKKKEEEEEEVVVVNDEKVNKEDKNEDIVEQEKVVIKNDEEENTDNEEKMIVRTTLVETDEGWDDDEDEEIDIASGDTSYFVGMLINKKMGNEIRFRKRFCWIDPSSKTFHWSKQESKESVSKHWNLSAVINIKIELPTRGFRLNSSQVNTYLNIEHGNGEIINLKFQSADETLEWSNALNKYRT